MLLFKIFHIFKILKIIILHPDYRLVMQDSSHNYAVSHWEFILKWYYNLIFWGNFNCIHTI